MTPSEELEERKRIFQRRESKLDNSQFGGLQYDSYLTGPDGVCVILYATEATTSEQIERAKVAAAQSRDVTGFRIVRIPQAWLDEEAFQAPATAAPGWVETCRRIVQEGAQRVDAEGHIVPADKSGGRLVDHFTAASMLNVYNALKPENQAKFARESFAVAHHIAFTLLEKHKKAG